MTIEFYSEDMAYESGGKITTETLDCDPKKCETVEQAAKAVFEAVKKKCKAYGQDPDCEVFIRTPEENDGKWYVCWEAGPFDWAVSASFAISGPWGYAEPYYGFDLTFYEE